MCSLQPPCKPPGACWRWRCCTGAHTARETHSWLGVPELISGSARFLAISCRLALPTRKWWEMESPGGQQRLPPAGQRRLWYINIHPCRHSPRCRRSACLWTRGGWTGTLYLPRCACVSGSFRVFDGIYVSLINLLTLSQVPIWLVYWWIKHQLVDVNLMLKWDSKLQNYFQKSFFFLQFLAAILLPMPCSVCRLRAWSGSPPRWSNRGRRPRRPPPPTASCWPQLKKRYAVRQKARNFTSPTQKLQGFFSRLKSIEEVGNNQLCDTTNIYFTFWKNEQSLSMQMCREPVCFF